ncbi:hypothetical protein [Calothrix sp. PCC 6303]|uniref:hypothetical protein n=1 Tax=Calothrix sp. PCC 6303 TaxID=1170562 RepID=UPI0002A00CB9|nr:hypothetical protein [Calothrix sp. PCC 6303]AFZ02401.1 hypothetical protein Cal6303_3468 [Calothrix sp. PCC 6303]
MITSRKFLASLVFLGFVGIEIPYLASTQVQAQSSAQSAVGNAVAFSCNDTEATIKNKRAKGITFGTKSIYIGYRQVTSKNKNPILISFQNSVRQWCREDYEVTGDDGTGYGLIWDGANNLYGVFSATGTQGTPSQDFRRFATFGWLPTYGSGGGPKVSIIAKIDPANGNVSHATFVTALLSTGKSNSLTVENLKLTGGALTVESKSWSSPRRADKSRMTCSGSSPFRYTITFTSLLNFVTSVSADSRCR